MSHRQYQLDRKEFRVRRNEREELAGKLLAKVPDLTVLDLEISESRPDGGPCENQYIRRVVVASAPALFELRCSYAECEGGLYDLTREILFALSERKTRFEGEHNCQGRCRSLDCTRVLKYVAKAVYRT